MIEIIHKVETDHRIAMIQIDHITEMIHIVEIDHEITITKMTIEMTITKMTIEMTIEMSIEERIIGILKTRDMRESIEIIMKTSVKTGM